jgi:rfaE bifunctional protein kinase chain/domain
MAAMELAPFLDRFPGQRVVVLGDLAVDCYVDTRPARVSREAPVIVLRYEGRRYTPGCAANTIMNLRALGAEVVPLGIVGDDEAGRSLVQSFLASGIPDTGIVVTGHSVVKIRLMSGDTHRPKQQIVRVDMEPDKAPPKDTFLQLIARAAVAEGAKGIVVSDYGYGAASPGLLRAAREVATSALVSVDSHLSIGNFDGADLLTPNEWEAAAYMGVNVETEEDASEVASRLRQRTGAAAVLLTRGNRGMLLADERGVHAIPIAGSTEIVDPSGAGDTVVSTATMARLAGASHLEAAHLANLAAGISVMKAGAQPVTLDELREAVARG